MSQKLAPPPRIFAKLISCIWPTPLAFTSYIAGPPFCYSTPKSRAAEPLQSPFWWLRHFTNLPIISKFLPFIAGKELAQRWVHSFHLEHAKRDLSCVFLHLSKRNIEPFSTLNAEYQKYCFHNTVLLVLACPYP